MQHIWADQKKKTYSILAGFPNGIHPLINQNVHYRIRLSLRLQPDINKVSNSIPTFGKTSK